MTVHIAIIDDGINEGLYDIGQLKYNIEITPSLHVGHRTDYDPFLPSHGTTCGAIIKKYFPDVSLTSVKVLNDDSKRGMKAQLIKALEWCADNGIRLVNLSLGTIDYRDFREIQAAVKRAVHFGMIIVAACNNSNVFTCPASLKEVIGVKCDLSGTLKAPQYIYNSSMPDGIEITAAGIHQLVKCTGESKITSPCNSFAAPMITAAAGLILQKDSHASVDSIREVLIQKAISLTKNKREHIQEPYKYMRQPMDIPIIALYDYAGKGCRGGKGKLHELFRADGYNAISLCMEGSEEDICNGVISMEPLLKTGSCKHGQALQEICRVYEPDIAIVNIDMDKMSQGCVHELEASLEMDIRIFIANGMSDQVKEHIHKDNGSNSILLLTQQNTEETAGHSVKAFTCSDESSVDRIYSYILGLFEANEKKSETLL